MSIKTFWILGQLNLEFFDQQVSLINILLLLPASWKSKGEPVMFRAIRNNEEGKAVNKFIFKNPLQ